MYKTLISEVRKAFASPWQLLKRYLFLTLYGVFKYLPTPFGDVLRWLCLKPFLKRLHTFWIKEGVTFHFPENISVGASALNEFTFLNGYGGIEIGDNVLIGANSMFFSADHVFDDVNAPIILQGLRKKPIVVKDNVFIGCGVTVLGNVTINSGAVIGAGSVVTTDVPENAIMAGVPAKIVRYRNGTDPASVATRGRL